MRKQRKINNFYVFYRISDNGYKNKIKLECATKINCLKNALKVFRGAKIVVFVDSVIESTDKAIHDLCDNLDNVEVKYIQCKSNPKSFRYVYEEALKLDDNDFVYFLEDDYLHLDASFGVMKEAAEKNYTDYITLYDHPDKYEDGCSVTNPFCRKMGERTVVFKTPSHHWKLTNSTTMTFGAFVDVLKRDKEIFWKHTDGETSDDFKIFMELLKNGSLLSSPIPSLSTHCENKYLAPFIDWGECVSNIKKCCIVFITHKEKLENEPEMAFKQILNVFGGTKEVFVVIPDKISSDYYVKFVDGNHILKMDGKHFKSVKTYNTMLSNSDFYEHFSNFEYILVCQDDCWVYEDKLDEFIKMDYDYYGAPWPSEPITKSRNSVGNGGLSLRRVSKMLEITKSSGKYNNDSGFPEDLWFCIRHKNEMKICPTDVACNFSIENITTDLLNMVKEYPMGVHDKKNLRLWGKPEKFVEFKKKMLK